MEIDLPISIEIDHPLGEWVPCPMGAKDFLCR
jgi:hypothetical protein